MEFEDFDPIVRVHIDPWAMACLLMQHVSSTFGNTIQGFGAYLFLIEAFRDTLAPASLVGIIYTIVGLAFSGYIGGVVDRSSRLQFVRWNIALQKSLQAVSFASFLVLMGPLRPVASAAWHMTASFGDIFTTWAVISVTIITASVLQISNTGMNVAVERDWVMTIVQGDHWQLSRVNAWMKTISLISRLAGPMILSILTASLGYVGAAKACVVIALTSMVIEYFWIQVVYDRFPVLQLDEERRKAALSRAHKPEEHKGLLGSKLADSPDEDESVEKAQGLIENLKLEYETWMEFAAMPIFLSAISVALGSITTLAMDGMGVSYFKIVRGRSDTFLASIRGVLVFGCFVSTLFMPAAERRFGSRKLGVYGLIFELIVLVPTVSAFMVDVGELGHPGPAFSSIMMFGGIIIARPGQLMFDLSQLKQLQVTLEHHPRRNRLTAMQSAMQSFAQLLKFVMCLVLSDPRHFKYTAVISWVCIVIALAIYLYFLKITGPKRGLGLA